MKIIVSLCSKFNMEAFSTEYRLVTYRVLSDGAEERIDPVSNPVIVAIVSAILGFLFGNISGWIAAKRDRRKLMQERYTQQYITEGIDPLLSYFVHKERELKTASYGDYMGLPEANPFPTHAEAAMRRLCGDRCLAKAISGINYEYGHLMDIVSLMGLDTDASEYPLSETISYIESLNDVLLRARKDLEEKIAKIGWRKNLLDTTKTCEILNEIEEYEPQLLSFMRQLMREKNRGTSSET